jgi:uncharacterized protein (TIGR03067 family)
MGRGICLLLFTSMLASGCCFKPPPSDQEVIIGKWIVVDFHSPAEKEDRSQRRKKLHVSSGTWSQQFQGEKFEDFEYWLDDTKTPKEISLAFTKSDGRRLIIPGIYELNGERLRLCLGGPQLEDNLKRSVVEEQRPTAFDARQGLLIIYCRAAE